LRFGQAVVGDHEGPGLGGGQMIEADRRHLDNAKLATAQQTSMARDHIKLGVDQHRNVETERVDTPGKLANLLCAVLTGVGRMRL